MNLEQMSLNQLCDLVRKLQQALTDSNLALMEQTELAERCRQQAETLEAERDRLMLEFCPDEISAEQLTEWEARQRTVSAENAAKIDSAVASLSDNEVRVLDRKVSAPQQHAQAALSDGLPPLPYPQWPSYGQNDECYSVEQMRAYGRLCIAASQQPAAAPADLEYKDVDSTDLWNEVARRVRADLAPAVSILAAAPAIQQEGRDWREDWHGGENQYECRCSTCGNPFFGHKRRITCKSCAIQQEGAALDERYAGCLATIRGLDKISMDLSAALIHLPIEEGARKRNIDYVARQDILDLVVAWRTAWDKNSAQRQPIDRAALALNKQEPTA